MKSFCFLNTCYRQEKNVIRSWRCSSCSKISTMDCKVMPYKVTKMFRHLEFVFLYNDMWDFITGRLRSLDQYSTLLLKWQIIDTYESACCKFKVDYYQNINWDCPTDVWWPAIHFFHYLLCFSNTSPSRINSNENNYFVIFNKINCS